MKHQPNMEYPTLPKSYKGMFPFKIGTTSFIYPDHYIPNVRMLGPYMDEIELLLFESQEADAILSKEVIAELGQMGRQFGLSYNVHLPTDVSITDRDRQRQKRAVETMIRVIDRVAPLWPSALVLHLPYDGSVSKRHPAAWRDRVYQNLEKILPTVQKSRLIAIETLDYPMELLADILVELDLSICLDLGHLMVYDYDVLGVFEQYASRASVLHLHGVESGRDHLALERLPDGMFATVLQVLKRFAGVVSLEVFSFEDLDASLKYLESRWKKT